MIVFGIPAMQVSLNPLPPESTLTHFRARIVRVGDGVENLKVVLADGERKSLMFPTPLYSTGRFYAISYEEQRRLTGCDAETYGAEFKYVLRRDFGVWKIDCKLDSVSYERISTEFLEMKRRQANTLWIGALVMSFFIVAIFIKNRKRK
jgi:hypothetical protein